MTETMNYNDNITNSEAFDNSELQLKSIIKAIGVGGGGTNAVNNMYYQEIPGVSFVVSNTDLQSLKQSPISNKLLLGYEITGGLGAGNNPEVGRAAAEASQEDIKSIFQDGTKMVFITAGMGGGTGTGAAPVVARVAKEAGILTIGIVTIPFLFEGEKKILKALDGAAEMRKHVDALLVINNERLPEIYPDLEFDNAFQKADDTLTDAARSISEIISEDCYINVDFQDVKTTLKDSGAAIISTGYGTGEKRVSKAIHNALNSPLLKSHDINSSKRLLFKLSYNRNAEAKFKTSEINELTQFTANLSKNIDVKWGVSFNNELGDSVKITILASGFDVTLHESKQPDETIIFPSDENKPHTTTTSEKTDIRITDEYGQGRIKERNQQLAKARYVVLKPSQFDDDEIIDKIEKSPAYNRNPKFNEELDKISSEPQNIQNTDKFNNDYSEPNATTIVF